MYSLSLMSFMKTLSSETIDAITRHLGHFLSDTFVLYVKTLNFHWNMVGREFFMYHKLLEEQYKELQEALDELAERIRMLGRKSPGSMKRFLGYAELKESHEELKAEQMIHELVDDHEKLVESGHKLINLTEEASDQGTADLLIKRIRSHAKQAWLLRSHLS